MNGIEKLIQKIDEKADAVCAERLSGVEQQAEAIRNDYRLRGEVAAAKILEQAKEQIQQDQQRAGGTDQLERSKNVLAAKHAMLNAAFERARCKLMNQTPAEKISFDLKTLKKADCFGDEIVFLNQNDHDAFGREAITAMNQALSAAGLPAQLVLSDDCRSIDGGFVLQRGRIETDCSYSALLTQMRTELINDVAKVLFS